jgi:hypothetical protein
MGAAGFENQWNYYKFREIPYVFRAKIMFDEVVKTPARCCPCANPEAR